MAVLRGVTRNRRAIDSRRRSVVLDLFTSDQAMGSFNRNRHIPTPTPADALTLGQMAKAGWEMVARCKRCGVVLTVDVAALIKLHGPDAIWWGRKPRCRVVGCVGRVEFGARAWRMGSWQSLSRTPTPQEIERFGPGARKG
jgi:hypothetical protein